MLILLYTATIFLGAFLLFLVQPMAAKAILPALGGSPSVWNTCMVFFQAALLAGYGYAHGLSRLGRPRVWMAAHAVVVLLPILILARAVPLAPGVPPVENPVPWLLLLLATTVGPFFVVLATTGPLIQRWFAATDHPRAADPYFLYAASNAGSLLALLAYPVVVEPSLPLGSQARLFAAGYVVFAVLVLACGAMMLRRGRARVVEQRADAEPVTNRQRLIWVALAFVPSSLLLGATQFVSTDLAVVPLLWVGFLAVYLVTFILAFADRQIVGVRIASILLPVVVLAVIWTMLTATRKPLELVVGLHVAVLFLGAVVCHRRLAISRPGPSRLTQYYLLIALGGALGGVFNALIAPVIFNSVVEYPIALVLACLMAAPWTLAPMRQRLVGVMLVVLPAGLAGVGLQLMQLMQRPPLLQLLQLMDVLGLVTLMRANQLILWVWVGVPLLACLVLVRRPRMLAGALALLLAVASLRPDPWGTVLFADRTFFGTVRVYEERTARWHLLFHGTTRHGVQALEPDRRAEPTLYYHSGSPIGDYFRARQGDRSFDRCAFVGLGVGTLAAYGRPGQSFTFYEIDPLVTAVAMAPDLFTYITDGLERGVAVGMELGDARLRLREAPAGEYDLIVLDAFTSDAIPVHLLTVQAMELYLSKLAPGGVLAFHVSNRYLDLNPVVASAARDLGLTAMSRVDDLQHDRVGLGAVPSIWMMVGRDKAALRGLTGVEGWYWYEAGPSHRAWTDDYSSVLGAFRR